MKICEFIILQTS